MKHITTQIVISLLTFALIFGICCSRENQYKPPKFAGGIRMPEEYVSHIDDPDFADRWSIVYRCFREGNKKGLRITYEPGCDHLYIHGFDYKGTLGPPQHVVELPLVDKFRELIDYLVKNKDIFFDHSEFGDSMWAVVPKRTKEYFKLSVYPMMENRTDDKIRVDESSIVKFIVSGKETPVEIQYVMDFILREFWEPLLEQPELFSEMPEGQ